MRIKDFITDETPTLKSVDTALDGLDMMDDFKLHHLPLLEGGKYLCLVSERDLLAMDDLDAPIGKPLLMAPSLRPEAYLHEAMALVARYDLTLLPVVGEEGKYVGAIRVERLLREVARWCGAEEEGGVVVLDIGPRDYALTEIARLVESNNAHVLSLLSSVDRETGRRRVILKIDLADASPVVRSFERFGYDVAACSLEAGTVDPGLRRRVDELLYYINL